MLDFLKIRVTEKKNGDITVWPDYITYKSSDLMIRGGAFYAIWDETTKLWSTESYVATVLIDKEIEKAVKEMSLARPDAKVTGSYLKYKSSKRNREWLSFLNELSDSYVPLDEHVIFNNTPTTKESYASHKLSYNLIEGKCDAYDEIMSTLYDPSEREKLEWAIGSIIAGDSKTIQKFLVLYGDKGTGKSTVINIYQQLLDGYWSVFTAKDLGRSNSDFALESFKTNPLLAIQHEGDLSKIEDNTRLNSIVSHEPMEINEKNKSKYMMRINSFLMLATNSPVKITDSKSGILRRLIDVYPSGRKIPEERYFQLVEKVQFELGPIAHRCLTVYKKLGKNHYSRYIPLNMMSKTNDFFNFVEENFFEFKELSEEGLSLTYAWTKYQEYTKESNVPYPMTKTRFKDEFKNYFTRFEEREGKRVNVYHGFKEAMFDAASLEDKDKKESEEITDDNWLELDGVYSEFDLEYSDIPAQYCKLNEAGKPVPKSAWDYVTTKLSDLDTREAHFCRPPKPLVDVDFDCKDKDGNKSLELCLVEAKRFPKTYAEVSQGGHGLHLYYIYDGDVSELEAIYDKEKSIEVKVHTGKLALRRKLTKCNKLKVQHIYSGLPIKRKEGKMLDETIFEGEKKLRNVIAKCLRKETKQPFTTPCVSLIAKALEDAYNSGKPYDVRDLRGKIQAFAASSHNQKQTCSKIVSNMHFCSKNYEEADKTGGEEYYDDGYILSENDEDKPIVIYDIESYQNFFGIGYKIYDPPGHDGEHAPEFMMFPSAEDCKKFMTSYRLVGFNNKKYDDIMLYLASQGLLPLELYRKSKDIIDNKHRGYCPFKSYADVFDFSKVKQSLKKFEIELDGGVHMEMKIPWDEPVPENMFEQVAIYCMNDVAMTEKVWNSKGLQKDWAARQILAEISGIPVGESNNNHSKVLMFGNDKNPQRYFIYTDLSKEFTGYEFNEYGIDKDRYIKDANGKPIFTSGKSIYLGEDPSEGGFAWGKPGVYGNVKAFDVASMHPSTMIALNLFGDEYTKRLKDLVDLRKALKHGNLDFARSIFDGRLDKYLDDPDKAKGLDGALKIVINSIYGLTAAHFPNPFKDERNVDNIVAKRGALFMIRLKKLVQDKGYEVVHCKTDCIKVADADDAISDFIMEEGRKYGYEFEVEHWFDKFAIVNKAAYVGRLRSATGELGDWVAVADEFKEPYVFKTLFSHEEVEFKDYCQTKSVKSAMYLDMNEGLGQMDPSLVKEMGKLEKKISKGEASEFDIARYDELCQEEAKHHNYIFVGKVGSFVPIKPGFGGGELVRSQNGKMYAVEGTTGFRWLESAIVKGTELENQIDTLYFEKLADDARHDIELWGDFDWFVSDTPYDGVIRVPFESAKAIKQLANEFQRGFEEAMNPPES